MTYQIFIGYRRNDSGATVGRLYDHLGRTYFSRLFRLRSDWMPLGDNQTWE